MRTWTFDTHPATAGPWADEPDKAQWVDEATGLDCLIRRHEVFGYLCGYVGVPPGHPWHGADPFKLVTGLDVNYGSLCDEDEETGICHVPEPGRPEKVWWLGFDCGHSWDARPPTPHEGPVGDAFRRLEEMNGATYKTFDDVKARCEVLAAQAKAAA